MAEVWPLFPSSLSETLEFATDVRATRSAEWRDSLKDATQFLTIGNILRSNLAEYYLELVRTNALGEWFVPEWPNHTKVPGGLVIGADEIAVDFPGAFGVGQQVFVGSSADSWEQGEVASVSGSDVTLVDGLSSSYPGVVYVAPMLRCIVPNGATFQSAFPSQGISMTFMSIDPVDLAHNPYPVHLGLPVVTDGRVPFQPLAGGINQSFDLFASGFGAYALQQAETYPRRRGVVSWYDKGSVNRWDRRRFLHFLRGMDGAFWLPTGQNDLVLKTAVTSGALSIRVTPIATNAEMVGRSITIREGNNSVTREITGASSIGDDQLLSIVATGVAFSLDAVVSLAIKSRLETDQVAITYEFAAGGLAAFCSAPVVEVP